MIDTPTCPTKKRRYATHADARAVLRKAKRRRRPGPQDPIRFYRCTACNGGYHLTSTKEGRP